MSESNSESSGESDGLNASQPSDETGPQIPEVVKAFHKVVGHRPTLLQVFMQTMSVLRLDGYQGPRVFISQKTIDRVLTEDSRERDQRHQERMTFMIIVGSLVLASFVGILVALYLVRDRPAVFDSILHWTALVITHGAAGTVGYQVAVHSRQRDH